MDTCSVSLTTYCLSPAPLKSLAYSLRRAVLLIVLIMPTQQAFLSLYIGKENMKICKRPPKRTWMHHPQCQLCPGVIVILNLRHLKGKKAERTCCHFCSPSVQKQDINFLLCPPPSCIMRTTLKAPRDLANKLVFR